MYEDHAGMFSHTHIFDDFRPNVLGVSQHYYGIGQGLTLYEKTSLGNWNDAVHTYVETEVILILRKTLVDKRSVCYEQDRSGT